MQCPDVEAFKARITFDQLKKWFAFYQLEPWGQPWLMAGRMTSLIRSALGVTFDRHDEERFLITYKVGDEYRSKIPQTEDEIAAKLASLPGLTETQVPAWRQSAKSAQYSRPARRGSRRA
jgi:hypothetical protein